LLVQCLQALVLGVKPQALAVFTISNTLPWYCDRGVLRPWMSVASKS
jgi:hypothetical protein